jgi:hypothetical protein
MMDNEFFESLFVDNPKTGDREIRHTESPTAFKLLSANTLV